MQDILLQANSHPEPTPDWAIHQAAALAASLEARLSLGVCQVHIPQASKWLANTLLKMDQVIANENRKSAANVETLTEAFKAAVTPNLIGETFVIDSPATVSHWQFAVRARTYDLSVIPIYPYAQMAYFAEGLVFDTGRPVLLLPELASPKLKFDRIAIAWDGSRVAARALADAIPFARKASSVSVVQVIGEKDLTRGATAAEAVRNLKVQGIAAEAIDVALEDGDAGATLQAYCERDARDLLVMGAFGHSRARQFVLGGVTRTILDAPVIPILMSH